MILLTRPAPCVFHGTQDFAIPHTHTHLKLYCYIFRCCGLPKFWIIFDMLGVHPNNFFLLHVQPLKA